MLNLNFNNETADSISDTDVESPSPNFYCVWMIITGNKMVFTHRMLHYQGNLYFCGYTEN